MPTSGITRSAESPPRGSGWTPTRLLLLGRAGSDLASVQAGRDGARSLDSLLDALTPRYLGLAQRHEHGLAACGRSGCAARGAPSRLDDGAGEVGARPHGTAGH